jgi:hypothetical protein
MRAAIGGVVGSGLPEKVVGWFDYSAGAEHCGQRRRKYQFAPPSRDAHASRSSQFNKVTQFRAVCVKRPATIYASG